MPEVDATLIASLYEAAVVPELWPTALDLIAKFAEGVGATLFSLQPGWQHFVASPGLQDCAEKYTEEGWPARTDRPLRLLRSRYPGFLGDHDVYSEIELENEPVYTEFLRPQGLGWGAATALQIPDERQIFVAVERSFDRGPFSRVSLAQLDAIRPHLARSALLSSQLRHRCAQAAAHALEMVGIPAAVLGPGGKILAANACAQVLMGSILQDRRRLVFVAPGADALLAEALQSIAAQRWDKVWSIPLPESEGGGPFVAHVLPIERAAADIFRNAAAVVLFSPFGSQPIADAAILEVLFDLSPTEAKIARAIARCSTLSEISRDHEVSLSTVRKQLNQVLFKTGTHRQAELVALLAGTGSPGAGPNN